MKPHDVDDHETHICHKCGCLVKRGRGSFYLVRIEAVADPSPPAIDDVDLLKSSEQALAEYEALLAEASDLSEREMLDQIYRRLTLILCTRCYRAWIENPLA